MSAALAGTSLVILVFSATDTFTSARRPLMVIALAAASTAVIFPVTWVGAFAFFSAPATTQNANTTHATPTDTTIRLAILLLLSLSRLPPRTHGNRRVDGVLFRALSRFPFSASKKVG
ncbi:MAG: hypothetical protein COW34_08315 [Armatimonadetes bacterium CG17_big_fil_post_rev_8_21_14_2_50_66_6]|nr:MAG: hypothetical protein COW34_08315 [Armatimonadetes bacterium CG17_big_fil_post_rev_8_21_14_2_50_66_6]